VELADRVERLERSNRRLRLGLALAVVASLVACAAAAGAVLSAHVMPDAVAARSVPEEVKARRFVLVDEAGLPRAVLERAESGGPQLLLTDAEGDMELGLFAVPGGIRGLALYDGDATRAAMTASPGGAATVAVEADGRASGGAITLAGSGSVVVRTWGAGGDVSLASPADHPARVEVRDAAGALTGRVPLSTEPFGPPGHVRPVRTARAQPAR
jgi:hypothetical protein